jgi:hypothetical protein
VTENLFPFNCKNSQRDGAPESEKVQVPSHCEKGRIMPMDYPALVPPPPVSGEALLNWRNVEEVSVCETSALLLQDVRQLCMGCVGVLAGPTEYLRVAVI